MGRDGAWTSSWSIAGSPRAGRGPRPWSWPARSASGRAIPGGSTGRPATSSTRRSRSRSRSATRTSAAAATSSPPRSTPSAWTRRGSSASTPARRPAASRTSCSSAARARVHAVDVGRGQLADAIARDPRVVVHDRTNARHLTRETLGEPVDLAVIDVSFISLVARPRRRSPRPSATARRRRRSSPWSSRSSRSARAARITASSGTRPRTGRSSSGSSPTPPRSGSGRATSSPRRSSDRRGTGSSSPGFAAGPGCADLAERIATVTAG